jgi:hypothetical protein
VALTVFELPGYLSKLADTLQRQAPSRAVTAIAQAYQRDVVQSMSGGSPSPPGTPPGRRTGTLARSIRAEEPYSSGPYSARTSVAPHTVYARIQQLGGHIYPRHTLQGRDVPFGPVRYSDLGFLRWESDGQVHFARHVYLPPRPYMVMRPETRTRCHDAAVAALQQVLAEATGG